MMNVEQRMIAYLVDNVVDYAAIGKTLAKNHPEIFLQLVEGELDVEVTAQKFATTLREIRHGNFVGAIKELRNTTGLGLKEAKDIVDVLYGRAIRGGYSVSQSLSDMKREQILSGLSTSEVYVMNARNEALLAKLWAALRR